MKNDIYKAVIFDLDGTLIDSMSIWRRVDAEFLGKRGIEVPQDLFAHLPQGNSYNQTAQYFKDRFNLPDSAESIMEEWTEAVRWHYQHDITLKEGIPPLLNWLKDKSIPIAVGTSNHEDLTKLALTQHNIMEYFKTIVTGTHEMKGKPFPDIFVKTANELDVSPELCIVIEDTLNGIRAAKSAGMYAIAIYDADSDEHRDLINTEADFTASDYYVLHKHLMELLG
jgi:beta-phosphoglucomutase-like phosphatase (HAD superfamily)